MPYSILRDVYTGGPQVFDVDFALGVIHENHIRVYVGGEVDGAGAQVYRAFTYNKVAKTVEVTAPIPVGSQVYRTRTVPKEELLAFFQGGADVTKRNLDLGSTHLMHAIHEILDGRVSQIEDLNGLYDLLLDFQDVLSSMEDAADRSEIASSIIDPAFQFTSVVALRAFNFGGTPPASVRVLGFYNSGDGGDWIWNRVPAATAYNVHEQSADGVYWTPAKSSDFPALALGFSLGAATAATNSASYRRSLRLVNSWGGGSIKLPSGNHLMEQILTQGAVAVNNVTIDGVNKRSCVLSRRSGDTAGSFLYHNGCTNIHLRNITIDGGNAEGFTAHGLQFAYCSGFTAENIHIRNFDASALSCSGDSGVGTYDTTDFVLRNISMDGMGIARNGILLNNCRDFTIAGVSGGYLTLTGAAGEPSVGIGVKTNCLRGLIYDVSLHTCRRAINIGAEGGVSQVKAWGVTTSNCISGIASALATDCHFTDVTLRTPAAEPDPASNPNYMGAQVAMRDATRCTATNINVRGGSNVYPVLYQRNTTNCLVQVNVWDNSPGETNLLTTVDTVTALRVDVDQYQGSGVGTPSSLLTLSAGTTGTRFFWRGDKILPA